MKRHMRGVALHPSSTALVLSSVRLRGRAPAGRRWSRRGPGTL